MLHTFNAREMINLQSETNYAFHTSVAEDEFPQVHDFYELSLITAGKMQLIVNQEVFLAEPGFLVLIQPGFVHTKRDMGGCHYMNIAFPVRTMEEVLLFLGLGEECREQLFNRKNTLFVQISQSDSCSLQTQLQRLSTLPESEILRVRAGIRFLVLTCLWRWLIPDRLAGLLRPRLAAKASFGVGKQRKSGSRSAFYAGILRQISGIPLPILPKISF